MSRAGRDFGSKTGGGGMATQQNEDIVKKRKGIEIENMK
jgi:hypothetical protein